MIRRLIWNVPTQSYTCDTRRNTGGHRPGRGRTGVSPSPGFPQPQGRGPESRRPLTGLGDGQAQTASNATPTLALRAPNHVHPKTNRAHSAHLDGPGKRKALHRQVPEPESAPRLDRGEQRSCHARARTGPGRRTTAPLVLPTPLRASSDPSPTARTQRPRAE